MGEKKETIEIDKIDQLETNPDGTVKIAGQEYTGMEDLADKIREREEEIKQK